MLSRRIGSGPLVTISTVWSSILRTSFTEASANDISEASWLWRLKE